MTDERILKRCFVISPIGEIGTPTRQRSDNVLNFIINPVIREHGYGDAERAEKIAKPGVITSQIIERIIDNDLVIADLTDENPNVFYELAVRHVYNKPCIHISQSKNRLPFDVHNIRTIFFDSTDLKSVDSCKKELSDQIKAIEQDPSNIDSPISMAIDLLALRKSGNPIEKSTADIIVMLQEILKTIHELKSEPHEFQDLPTTYRTILESLSIGPLTSEDLLKSTKIEAKALQPFLFRLVNLGLIRKDEIDGRYYRLD